MIDLSVPAKCSVAENRTRITQLLRSEFLMFLRVSPPDFLSLCPFFLITRYPVLTVCSAQITFSPNKIRGRNSFVCLSRYYSSSGRSSAWHGGGSACNTHEEARIAYRAARSKPEYTSITDCASPCQRQAARSPARRTYRRVETYELDQPRNG